MKKTIKTNNFILRSYKKGDEFDVAKNINDKKISQNTLTIPYPYTLKDAKNYFRTAAKKEKKGEAFNFFIEIGGEVVGSIGFHNIEKDHKAEIGYWLARKLWGEGIMSEAVRLMTEFGFVKLKLRRIYGHVYTFNEPSKRILEKSGYKLEGVLKNEVMKNKKLIDVYLLAKTDNYER